MRSDLSVADLRHDCTERLTRIIDTYLQTIPALALKTALEETLAHQARQTPIFPCLVYATGSIFAAPQDNLDAAATAMSLMAVHMHMHHADTMPSGEGVVMHQLTSDALTTLAMQVLSDHPTHLNAEQRLKMMRILNEATGAQGLLAGEALDDAVQDADRVSRMLLENIYRLKTGALTTASIELGRLCSGDSDERHAKALGEFAQHLGLALHIEDDIAQLEMTGSPQHSKVNYPKLFGIQNAKFKVESLYQNALQAIDYLGYKAQLLRELSASLLLRKK